MTTVDLPIQEVSPPFAALFPEGRGLTFQTFDGVELFYREWLPATPVSRALLLFHRGHEHSGRFAEMAARLGLEDTAVFAWDARGHGRSPGERGYARDFADVIRDMDCFARHISREYSIPLADTVVLGHSVAAVAAAAWVHDYAPGIRGLVLATPAFDVKLYVPFALTGLRMVSLVRKKAFIKSYVKAKMLTHDPEQAVGYANDPLVSKQIAVNVLLDLFDTSKRLLADAGTIRVPTLILSAGSDWVVKNKSQQHFFERIASPDKRHVLLDGFSHAIFHEKERERVFAEVRRFVAERFAAAKPDESAPLRADREGFTKEEHDRLATPLPWIRGLPFTAQKLFLQTFGRLSKGVRIGWRTGFDSGQSLDHVYENRPRGFTPLGWVVDRVYLNAIGWRGIRQRKTHLQELLRQAVQGLRAEHRPVRILDIAAGPGRYLLEALKEFGGDDITAVLRDHNPDPLEAGRQLARDMGLTNVTYETGDAFNTAALSAVEPRPDIAVVSGLYELFPDNAKVLASLHGLAGALRDGGYLVYTNQPWHPQVEMIARVLHNRQGRPWVMRRRSQAEMDELVKSAGFEKIDTRVDRWGIFTVSLAIRRADAAGAGETL